MKRCPTTTKPWTTSCSWACAASRRRSSRGRPPLAALGYDFQKPYGEGLYACLKDGSRAQLDYLSDFEYGGVETEAQYDLEEYISSADADYVKRKLEEVSSRKLTEEAEKKNKKKAKEVGHAHEGFQIGNKRVCYQFEVS